MKSIACLLLILLPFCAFAQPKEGQARLDSLIAEVPRMGGDTAAVDLMNSIALGYAYIRPEEELKWATKALALAQEIGWRAGEGWAYNGCGINYLNQGAAPSALDAFLKALRILEDQGNKTRIGGISVNIGSVYLRQKDYPKALEWYDRSLKIFEEQDDQKGMLVSLGNIGLVYEEHGKNREALAYKLKSLRIAEALNDKKGIIVGTLNVGVNYTNIKQYATALVYFFKGLRLAAATNDKRNAAVSLGNAGEAYYRIATDSAAPKPDSLVPATRAANLAKAADYLRRSIAASREAQLYDAVPEFAQYLSDALIAQGDYKGALGAYRQSVAVKDSLYNTANNEKITNLETRRAVELKDKDIRIAALEVAGKRNERVFFIAGIVLLLLITGILARNFRKQQHSNALLSKEKKRSDDLLLNILPAEVAEELKEHGAARARQYDDVTVLFTDFVDFTGTAEQLSPHQLVKELHECFTAFDAIVARNGLEKIKTIGDAYLAVCGMPLSDPLHATKTVQAALEIRAFIEERKKRERVFEIRIGINSGPVVAGIVGVKKFAYDIWGDTVNTAARMEQHSEAGRINISGATYALVKDDFTCISRGKIAAKHKGEVEMYFVEALSTGEV